MGAVLQVHSYTSQHSPALSPCLLLSGVGVTSDGVYTLYTVLYCTVLYTLYTPESSSGAAVSWEETGAVNTGTLPAVIL